MAIRYSQFDKYVKEFNEKYNVKISMMNFYTRGRKSGVTEKQYGNLSFYSLLSDAISQMVQNRLDNPKAPAPSAEVMYDLDRIVVEPYRKVCVKEYKIPPEPMGGMTDRGCLELIKVTIDKSPVNLYERAKRDYLNGKLRIRDMVAKANSIEDDQTNLISVCRELAGCVCALENVNASRTTTWRRLHPFRNRAEQRDAALIRAIVNHKIGLTGEREADFYANVQKMDDNIREDLARTNRALGIETTEPKSHVKETIEHVPIEINSIDKETTVKTSAVKGAPTTQRRAKQSDFLKVGYVPNPADIRNEWELVNPLHEAVQRNEYLTTEAERTAKRVLLMNFARCRATLQQVEQKGIVAGQAYVANELQHYNMLDQSTKRDHADYVPPEIPRELQREHVEIDLKDETVTIIAKVEERTTGAKERSMG